MGSLRSVRAPSRRSSRPRRGSTSSSTTPARCPRPRRRRPRRHRGDPRADGRRPVRAGGGLLPLLEATPGSRVIAVTSGGMYTQRAPLDDLESRRASTRARGLCPGQAGPGRAHARVGAPARAGGVAFAAMHPGWADTPGLAESLPGSTGSWARCSGHRRRGSTRSSGSRRTPTPTRSTGACSSTDVRGRSTAFRRPASRRPTAAACGTSSSRLGGIEDPAPER